MTSVDPVKPISEAVLRGLRRANLRSSPHRCFTADEGCVPCPPEMCEAYRIAYDYEHRIIKASEQASLALAGDFSTVWQALETCECPAWAVGSHEAVAAAFERIAAATRSPLGVGGNRT